MAGKGIPEKNEISEKTFGELSRQWLATSKEKLASTTYDRYHDVLVRDILPEYEDTPMKDVTMAEVNRFMVRAPKLAEEDGRTMKASALQIAKAVMIKVIRYAAVEECEYDIHPELKGEVVSYEELTPEEIERICIRARYNHCPELFAALLSMYSGLRIGEICGLSSDDVDSDRMEAFIHSTVHRVRNTDKDSHKKTVLIVEEIPRKNQIRKVKIPDILKEYVSEFKSPGRMFIRMMDGKGASDPRTLEKRLERIMDAFDIKNINFERLRKTYMKGKADEQLLNNIFLGIRPVRPYYGALDTEWLTDEMSRDLAPLRLLTGLSHDEMGSVLGISESAYREMEEGKGSMDWDQYLALLFLFHYNGRTIEIVDSLGLFPQALKECMRLGEKVQRTEALNG